GPSLPFPPKVLQLLLLNSLKLHGSFYLFFSHCSLAHPAFPPEYPVNPEYLEREIPKVYPGCSGVYPYHPFSLGFAINESSSGEAPSPPGISLQRGFRHIPSSYVPGNATTVSVNGAGDFPQGYYTPLRPFIPPGFLTGIHYIPAPVSLNILAETTKEVHGKRGSLVTCFQYLITEVETQEILIPASFDLCDPEVLTPGPACRALGRADPGEAAWLAWAFQLTSTSVSGRCQSPRIQSYSRK
uniref:Uncharacterized protein n=1 Tax=Zonotrichia albicollis TaxID=44394 RepID=A0A8D2M8G6_ZONAL